MIHTLRLDNKKMVTDFVTEPQIGDILQRDDNSFIRIGNLSKQVKNFEEYVTLEQKPRDILHTNEDGTSANFNVSADLPIIAQGDLVLDFKKQNSRFVALKNVIVEELDLMALGFDTIEDILRKNKLSSPLIRQKIFFVACVLKASSGTYIYSGANNNRVVLRANGSVPISGVPIALEGNLDVVWNKKHVQRIISSNPINTIFQAVSKRKLGWEILG